MSLIKEVLAEQTLEEWVLDIIGMVALAIVCGAFVVLGLIATPPVQ